jgi:hypothetical protein
MPQPTNPGDWRWAPLALSMTMLGLVVISAVAMTRGPGGPVCAPPCAEGQPLCQVAGGTCPKCSKTDRCPTPEKPVCQDGTCIPSPSSPCGDGCRSDQVCDHATSTCVCPPSSIDDGKKCWPAIGKNPKNCNLLKTNIASDLKASGLPEKKGHEDSGPLFMCAGVQGTDAANSGNASEKAPWSMDQIYLDYSDDPTVKPRSLPGNKDHQFDAKKVSVVNPSGCYAQAQTNDKAGTGNCSRGLRLASLFLGQPADAPAGVDETRDMGDWQQVGNTFLALHKIWGASAGGSWGSGGTSSFNVYPRPTPAGIPPALRLRLVGDLWGVKSGVTTSTDGVPLTPGLEVAPHNVTYSTPGPENVNGCGGTGNWPPGGSPPSGKCAKAGKPLACGKPPSCGTPASASNPCLLSVDCSGFLPRTTSSKPYDNPPLAHQQNATAANKDPAGMMTTEQRGVFARCGSAVTTTELYGPGLYEFTLKVPAVPHAYDDMKTGSTLPNPNVDLDANCLPGYVFALWLYTETELYTIYDPSDPGKSGQAESATGPRSGTGVGRTGRQGQEQGAVGAASWVPSEQGMWSAHSTNTCDQSILDGMEPGLTIAKSAALPTKAGSDPLHYWSAGNGSTVDWEGKWSNAAANAATIGPCVANNGTVGGGGTQGGSTGTEMQEAVGSRTFRLLGCDGPCTDDKSCQYLGDFKCSSDKQCVPTDATSPLSKELATLFAKSKDDQAKNCLAYQQSWQTGKYGNEWCGSATHSLTPKPCVEVNKERWNRSIQSADLGANKATATPEIPYFVQSDEVGGNLYAGAWGGDNVFAVINHEIDIEIPSNTPVTDLNVNRAGGGWGMESMNLNTWLADNNSYTSTGETPWYTQGMVTTAWADYATPTKEKPGAWKPTTREECDTEYRSKRTFASKPDTTVATDPGMDRGYAVVKYKVDWWADEDPTKSYIKFYVNDRLVYSTSRFIPTRGGRWIIGPWPARWGAGYSTDAAGKRASNAQPWDFVYVDLLSMYLQPYHEGFVPAGTDFKCLKLRDPGTTYDQQLVGITKDDITNVANNVLMRTSKTDYDKAWGGMTCTPDGKGTFDCEVRCALRVLNDWQTANKAVFPNAKFDLSKMPTAKACSQDPIDMSGCAMSPNFGVAAGSGAAVAATPATPTTSHADAWKIVLIVTAIGLGVAAGVTIWLFVKARAER